MAKAKTRTRNSPTEVRLGADGKILIRLDEVDHANALPLRQLAEQLYDRAYGTLPRPSFNRFLAYLIHRGIAAVETEHPARR